MLRTLRLLIVLAATLLIGLSFAPGVSAQDKKGDQEYRLDLVRRMDKDQKARLKRALEQFKRLPPEKQKRLRQKVKKIGDERLMGLAGKDVKKLRKRHEGMRKRFEALLQMIGPERLAGLTDDEKAYVHAMAGRRFHEYFKTYMLKFRGPTDRVDWKNLPEAERSERAHAARGRIETAVLERRSEEERAAYAQTAGDERKALMREWMEAGFMKLAMDFAPLFDRAYLTPFLDSPPEERARQVNRFKKKSRWYEVARFLSTELPREQRHRLFRLRPDQLAKVHELWEKGAELPPAERRTNVLAEIDRLYAEAAVDGKDGRFRPPHRRGGGSDGGDRNDRRKRRGPRRR